jgi:hypothetical protein
LLLGGVVSLVLLVDMFCFVDLEGLFGAFGYTVVSILTKMVVLVGLFPFCG